MSEENKTNNEGGTPEWAQKIIDSMNSLTEKLTTETDPIEKPVEVPVPPTPQPQDQEEIEEEIEDLDPPTPQPKQKSFLSKLMDYLF